MRARGAGQVIDIDDNGGISFKEMQAGLLNIQHEQPILLTIEDWHIITVRYRSDRACPCLGLRAPALAALTPPPLHAPSCLLPRSPRLTLSPLAGSGGRAAVQRGGRAGPVRLPRHAAGARPHTPPRRAVLHLSVREVEESKGGRR